MKERHSVMLLLVAKMFFASEQNVDCQIANGYKV